MPFLSSLCPQLTSKQQHLLAQLVTHLSQQLQLLAKQEKLPLEQVRNFTLLYLLALVQQCTEQQSQPLLSEQLTKEQPLEQSSQTQQLEQISQILPLELLSEQNSLSLPSTATELCKVFFACRNLLQMQIPAHAVTAYQEKIQSLILDLQTHNRTEDEQATLIQLLLRTADDNADVVESIATTTTAAHLACLYHLLMPWQNFCKIQTALQEILSQELAFLLNTQAKVDSNKVNTEKTDTKRTATTNTATDKATINNSITPKESHLEQETKLIVERSCYPPVLAYLCYELSERLVIAAGKEGGEDYIPYALRSLLVGIGEREELALYDPFMGIGSNFAEVVRRYRMRKGQFTLPLEVQKQLIGYELFPETATLAAIYLACQSIDLQIVNDNSFMSKELISATSGSDSYSTQVQLFSKAASNPPFNLSHWKEDPFTKLQVDDFVTWQYGTPSNSNANGAWVQQHLAHLDEQGISCLVMSQSFFAHNASTDQIMIREKLLQAGMIQAVILLPPALSTNTEENTCILITDSSAPKVKPKHFLLLDLRQVGQQVQEVTYPLQTLSSEIIETTIKIVNTYLKQGKDSSSSHSNTSNCSINNLSSNPESNNVWRNLELQKLLENVNISKSTVESIRCELATTVEL